MKSIVALIFAAIMILLGSLSAAFADNDLLQLTGVGQVGRPLHGQTIKSPSDFGFAVSKAGGNFLCSMGGSVTGGFMGLTLMDVEGPVAPHSLVVREGVASFAGIATIALVPGMHGEKVQILNNIPFSVTVGLGGPEDGYLILRIPAFTGVLGGDTGGKLRIGRIVWGE